MANKSEILNDKIVNHSTSSSTIASSSTNTPAANPNNTIPPVSTSSDNLFEDISGLRKKLQVAKTK